MPIADLCLAFSTFSPHDQIFLINCWKKIFHELFSLLIHVCGMALAVNTKNMLYNSQLYKKQNRKSSPFADTRNSCASKPIQFVLLFFSLLYRFYGWCCFFHFDCMTWHAYVYALCSVTNTNSAIYFISGKKKKSQWTALGLKMLFIFNFV